MIKYYTEHLNEIKINQARPRSDEIYNISQTHVDGTELSKIQNLFEGFPVHLTEEPQIWSEDFAQYIALNMATEIPWLSDRDGLVAYDGLGNVLLRWHLGEKLHSTDMETINSVRYLTATYNEMPWILSRMKNIPYVSNANNQVWCGSMAKFIAAQLPAQDGQQE